MATDTAGDLARLAKAAGLHLVGAWESVGDTITRDDYVELAAELQRQANIQAARRTLRAFLRQHAAARGSLPPAAGLTVSEHSTDITRITRALETITASGTDHEIRERLQRLGRGEAADSAHRARSEAIRASDAEAWVRGLEPGACELCVWWWREGRTWPIDHIMPVHTGCTCVQEPVYGVTAMSTVQTRRRARIAEAEANTRKYN